MKKYIYSLLKVSAAAGLLLLPKALPAQENTPAAYERLKSESHWMNSANAAGAFLDRPKVYTQIEAGYDWQSGDFHRPQQAEKDRNLRFGTEGSAILKGLYAWGRFSYDRNSLSDNGYSASVIDPYRGMPYYVVDTVPSDWKKQFYNLEFRLASREILPSFRIGLDGIYRASVAAKQRDIRMKNDAMFLEVRPGVVYSIGSGHHIGGNFVYSSYKEDVSMTNSSSDVSLPYYALYGLGTSVAYVGSGWSITNYTGDNYGFDLQYNYRGPKWNVLLEAGYNRKVEDYRRRFAPQEKIGSVRDSRLDGKLRVHRTGYRFSHLALARYRHRQIDGIEYLTQVDNSGDETFYEVLYAGIRSKYKTDDFGFDYAFLRNRGAEYAWRAEAGVRYIAQKDKYLLPRSDFRYKNLSVNVSAKYNFKLTNELSRRFLLHAGVDYHRNLSGEYDYNGSNSEYPTVTEITAGDLAYLTTNHTHYLVSGMYSQKIREDLKANLFVRVALDYASASGQVYNHRSLLSVSIGSNF